MFKVSLICFAVGTAAGLVAFTGNSGPAWAEALFVAAFVAGVVLALIPPSDRRSRSAPGCMPFDHPRSRPSAGTFTGRQYDGRIVSHVAAGPADGGRMLRPTVYDR